MSYEMKAAGVCCFFFFQAEDGIRDIGVTGVQTCALPISAPGTPREVGTPPRRAPRRWRCRPWRVRWPSRGRRRPRSRRSEEGRVGEEWRSRGSPYHLKKNTNSHYVTPLFAHLL